MHTNQPTQSSMIESAIKIVAEESAKQTDGRWLERLVVEIAPAIVEWDISETWLWPDWPERENIFPNSQRTDIGIDVVAMRRSDSEPVAIQCKARMLDEEGRGNSIRREEINRFGYASADPFWTERWIVTNGDNPLAPNALATVTESMPITVVNIDSDLQQQLHAASYPEEECPHCDQSDEESIQIRSCMQNEAVEKSIEILRAHEKSTSGGLPKGEARGKIILPCGTGKTRIALRIVEELTEVGKLAVVLCPSIALVAQIRREFLQNSNVKIRSLAVCSDKTAGYTGRKETSSIDPTIDLSRVSASEVKGSVTTDSEIITSWVKKSSSADCIGLIIGTYQSSHKIGEALRNCQVKAEVLIADEAHRTAGLKRIKKFEERLRDFTVCHDRHKFPVRFRIYQTATPRVYDTSGARSKNNKWLVRNMDDETVFGVELYRKSYMEAVKNHWLTDYRIIALGINDNQAYKKANELARQSTNDSLSTTHFLRGLTLGLVMAGATRTNSEQSVSIKSCIAFMNSVGKSKSMTDQLQSKRVRKWVKEWLKANSEGAKSANYTLEHLDASDNVTARENAKSRLAKADENKPHGILNVGIFGEGTDAPSLSSVAFLEARKSPIDVIQAVGRVMRRSVGKSIGYVICPIIIPPNVDAETWLKTSGPNDGWQELGQVLLALRAHDSRIEDNLANLLKLYIPSNSEFESTMVAFATKYSGISYGGHYGEPGQVDWDIVDLLSNNSIDGNNFFPLNRLQADVFDNGKFLRRFPRVNEDRSQDVSVDDRKYPPPATIVTGKVNDDDSIELRIGGIVRDKPSADGTLGPIDFLKSKRYARSMINLGKGKLLMKIPSSKFDDHHEQEKEVTGKNKKKRRRSKQEIIEAKAEKLLDLSGLGEHGQDIVANLLSESGLTRNRVDRDLNLLEDSVKEASRHLREDGLANALDKHFGLHRLDNKRRREQADGCTIGSLLLMNAAMLHQRISSGGWMSGVIGLANIKNDADVVNSILRQWNDISRHDFLPILKPAIAVIEAIKGTGKTVGLERALRHIAIEAERIAEAYADMGSDHAGPLFNRVMGNQDSDGAFFTRPVAASIVARLALDNCGDVDWSNRNIWKKYKIVDIACGSGTLLAATITDMKRRALDAGTNSSKLVELQKIAVEDTVKGLDINPVSLQLAASQLTAGNQDVRYSRMGLHQMPYGPRGNSLTRVSVGSLELFGQESIVSRRNDLGLADEKIDSSAIWAPNTDAELEDVARDLVGARIVIMNPPFTNRTKMGEKFTKTTQKALRSRTDDVEQMLADNYPYLKNFSDKSSIQPLFLALADRILDPSEGILAMICPTIALSSTTGQHRRTVLAERYHINVLLTCHVPRQFNLSQNTELYESIVIATRYAGDRPPTRVINLDRMPLNEFEVDDFYRCLSDCSIGNIANGWGEVSEWPADRIKIGDWTAAIWRSPTLAAAASKIANDSELLRFSDYKLQPSSVGRQLRGSYKKIAEPTPDSVSAIHSKGADSQKFIEGSPDSHWVVKKRNQSSRLIHSEIKSEPNKLLDKSSYLLVTAGQNNSSARLTAVAGDEKLIGNNWYPVLGLNSIQAKALAVYLNSTVGRLQLMRTMGKTLSYTTYSTNEMKNIKIPNIKCKETVNSLSRCWNQTRSTLVPQFRDGDCEVRRLWDNAVCDAIGWDRDELTQLRRLLCKEPHVRNLGYNQYEDEPESVI